MIFAVFESLLSSSYFQQLQFLNTTFSLKTYFDITKNNEHAVSIEIGRGH